MIRKVVSRKRVGTDERGRTLVLSTLECGHAVEHISTSKPRKWDCVPCDLFASPAGAVIRQMWR